jgi:Ribbon-helix-helix protein, copG family
MSSDAHRGRMVQASFTMSGQLLERVDRLAAAQDRSRAGMLRVLVASALGPEEGRHPEAPVGHTHRWIGKVGDRRCSMCGARP